AAAAPLAGAAPGDRGTGLHRAAVGLRSGRLSLYQGADRGRAAPPRLAGADPARGAGASLARAARRVGAVAIERAARRAPHRTRRGADPRQGRRPPPLDRPRPRPPRPDLGPLAGVMMPAAAG